MLPAKHTNGREINSQGEPQAFTGKVAALQSFIWSHGVLAGYSSSKPKPFDLLMVYDKFLGYWTHRE